MLTPHFDVTPYKWNPGSVAQNGDDGDTYLTGTVKLNAFWDSFQSFMNGLIDGIGTPWRNRIINGNMDIWQAGATATGSGLNAIVWGPDRFLGQAYAGVTGSGSSTITLNQQAFTAGQSVVPGNPAYYARLKASAVGTAVTGAFIRTLQYIEDVRSLAGGWIAVSFYAKADVARTVAIGVGQNFGTGGSAATTTGASVAITTAWARYTVQIQLPSVNGKTIGANSSVSVGIYLYNSDPSAGIPVVGSWSVTPYLDITKVQVEQVAATDSPATEFELRPLGVEEIMCKRFLCVLRGGIQGRWSSTSVVRLYTNFDVPMRRVPDFSVVSTTLALEATAQLGYTMTGASITTFRSDTQGAAIDFTGTVASGPAGNSFAQLNTVGAALFRAEF